MDSFVFARHTPDCRFKRDRLYRRCNCPKWVEGRFNRERIRKSAATRLWDEAEQFRLKLEQALTYGLPLSSLNGASVLSETPATALSSPSVLTPQTPPAPPIIVAVSPSLPAAPIQPQMPAQIEVSPGGRNKPRVAWWSDDGVEAEQDANSSGSARAWRCLNRLPILPANWPRRATSLIR